MRVAAALGAALVLAACAPVPSRPDLLGPSHARAKRLEADGQLRPALLEWKVARAIDPNDAETRANEARLAARIEGLVAARVTEARGALQRGAPLQARRLLLSALALDPTNTTAAELLRGIGEVDSVTYTVRAGDTLASVARYLASYTEEYLLGLNVACRVQIPNSFPERAVSGEARHHLFPEGLHGLWVIAIDLCVALPVIWW